MMDRRTFLRESGLLLAASGLTGYLTSCDSGFQIPCLGPAPPPSPQSGMTYIRASEIGCALDCDLRNGRNKYTGGAATDDAARINAAMAAASATNPITLIIDGSASISGLFLPAGGNWHIAGLGCGTGFFVKTGSNNDGIHNGPPDAGAPSDPGPPAPARSQNVSLKNFTVNGNQGTGRQGDSTTGKQQGAIDRWYCGINLMNLDNILLERVVVVNTPSYHVRFSNVGNVTVSGCVLKSRGPSTDGLHFDGPVNDITIDDCDFTTDDDSIALNCPEGYSGDISRVAVSNCTFSGLSLMRLYTTNGSPAKFSIDAVTVSNCRGRASEAAFLLGVTNGSAANSIASLSISDCVFQGPAVIGVAENFGSIVLKKVSFVPSASTLGWVEPQPNHICAFVRPSPLYGGVTSVGSSLAFENCRIYRNGTIEALALILEHDSVIQTLVFNGFSVEGAVPELLDIGGGEIQKFVIHSIDSSRIAAPVSPGGFSGVGLVSGTGVLATGWEFPDAVMADGVAYVSANSGLPSIKHEGSVTPYP